MEMVRSLLAFVGADDSVCPNDDPTISGRAGRVARPYRRLPYPARPLCGAMWEAIRALPVADKAR